ncbi:hypothetical protein K2173_004015 [Erythroxylum novogranatense]|uniref:Uncharacterized protein n=1 Tax=Erythroxylum novogranatense TaxID=1862640 RepID=A0AAV8SJY8_9ROSI|nr:hypothetical protein K2173_004015 [Erythroxylum novogranatense]
MKTPSTAPQGRPSRRIVLQLVFPLPELAPSASLPVSGTAPSLTPGTGLRPLHQGDDVASTVEEEIEQGSDDTEEREDTDEEGVQEPSTLPSDSRADKVPESAPGVNLPPASTVITLQPPTQCSPEQREVREAARPPTHDMALLENLDPALHEHHVASMDSRGPTLAALLPSTSSLSGPAGPTIVHPPAIDDTSRPSGPGDTVCLGQGMSTGIRQIKGKEPVSTGPKRGLGIQVETTWSQSRDGYAQFTLCSKLADLKHPLRHLNRSAFSHISSRVREAQQDFHCRYQEFLAHPEDDVLRFAFSDALGIPTGGIRVLGAGLDLLWYCVASTGVLSWS